MDCACQNLDWIERTLDDHRFMAGECFTLADCAFLPRFGLAETYAIGFDRDRKALAGWFDRVRDRPSYALALPKLEKGSIDG
ncbi:glutathione S-transferase family protein [Roseiarcus fermentans]|uniref:glutathione S-transferase family protein n=1 Tax=Roseiarcus fermentans TaxID=1473586 RepID=UPI000DEBE8A3